MKKEEYGNQSISMLKGADRVRKRPGVIFGSDGREGCQHAVFEIMSNAIDEARGGYGNRVTVTRFQDLSIQVEDCGRGCPVDYNEKEGRFNWELVFCELYAGGKFGEDDGENYEYSLGLNGLGSCATQYSSTYMDVTVMREGFLYELHFEKGENIGGLKKTATKAKETGTKIRWMPDLEVFTDIDIPLDFYRDVMKQQAVVNAGVVFVLQIQQEDGSFVEEEFCYDQGIFDYVSQLAGETPLTQPVFWQTQRQGRDRADKGEYRVRLSVSLCFTNKDPIIQHYHNSSWLEHGGSPEKAMRSALISAIDGRLKSGGKYQKGEGKITFPDIMDALIFVSNNFSTQTSFENQTKKAINNKFVQEAMTEFLRSQLEVYFIENPFDADKICEQVLINKRSRETAEKTRLNIKKKLSGSLDISNRVQKFVDCRSKDLEQRELYIVEGDSAMGACKLSRDAEFQAIMPVRGKILNCLKADYGKIFKSDIITDLLKVMGCGVEVKDKHVKELSAFDLSALRWNKIIICTDADVDGFQIRTLILAMLYRLTPTLIQEGYVYIAESPLYEITVKDKTYFAYSEPEKVQILNDIGDKKYDLQRSKGLGENEPDMMWLTTMSPDSRRLVRVMPESAEMTANSFNMLLGDNLQGRKDHIADNGHKYIDLADIS